MVGVPLAIDVRAGAVEDLAHLLADRRISAGGRVAVAVGPGLGRDIASRLAESMATAEVVHISPGSISAAQGLAATLRGGYYDALVGIGGGRLLDTAKWAATLVGLPLVAVATNLAHDGIASPVASLEHDGRKNSYGVQMPIAVVVDLDYVLQSPAAMRRGGVGDVVSNLAAIADWELAATTRGEMIDGAAVTFARNAASALLYRTDSIDDVQFLTALAEGLVLSGLAMAVAGSSRPCSGGDHEILHAIDALFPGTSNHGELAGIGALFTTFLRADHGLAADLDRCLSQHGLARSPTEIGLSVEQFCDAVLHAPTTRPDRYTILEHLALEPDEVRRKVDEFVAAFDSSG